MTEFTLSPELGVIIWNAKYVCLDSKRTLRVPYVRELKVESNYDLTQERIDALSGEYTDEDCPIQYKEYIFERTDILGKNVWMTPYLPDDPVQRRLLTTSEED